MAMMKSKLPWVVVVAGVVLLATLGLFAGLHYGPGLYQWMVGTPSAPQDAPPTIVVETAYPGANARMTADAVAAPIDQQVDGVEHALHLRSHCTDSGTYKLAVTFAPGTDLQIAQLLVQNRVALAQPLLPAAVQQAGITVRKLSPAVHTLLVLASPDGRFDELYLSNYATIQLHDELERLPGVGAVAVLGRRDSGLQIWLDPDKLAARGLNAADVMRKLEEQNLRVAASVGAPLDPAAALTVNTMRRLMSAEELDQVVLKVAPDGARVLLRDIARIELGMNGERGAVRFGGRPAVGLAIHPLGPDIDRKALNSALDQLLQRLRTNLPDGLTLETAFDFAAAATPNVFLVDVDTPSGNSAERNLAVLEKCDAVIRSVDGVTRTLVTAEDPFAAPRARPCILVGIAPEKRAGGREQIAADLRNRLRSEIREAGTRINDLAAADPGTPGGYPIAFAVSDTSDIGYESLSKLADRLIKRLGECPELIDVGISPPPAEVHQIHFDIDRKRAADLGVPIADIERELQVLLSGARVGRANSGGRSWQLRVRSGEARGDVEAIKRHPVRTATGQTVPLAAIVSVREVSGPSAIDRLDLYPSVEISANPAPGVTVVQARARCEAIAGEETGRGFRVTWLSAVPR